MVAINDYPGIWKEIIKEIYFISNLLPNKTEYDKKVSQTKMQANMVYESSFERNAVFSKPSISCLGNASSETSYIPSKMWFFLKCTIFPYNEKNTNK